MFKFIVAFALSSWGERMRALSLVILCLFLSVQAGWAEMSPDRIFEAMRKNMPSEAKCTKRKWAALRYDFGCDYEMQDGPYAMAYQMKADGNIRNISVSLTTPMPPKENDAPLRKMMFDFLSDIGVSSSQTNLCLQEAKRKSEPRGMGWADGSYWIRCIWSNSGQERTIILIENSTRSSPF